MIRRMAKQSDRLGMLQEVPLFQDLTKRELKALVGHGKEVDHRAGKAITEEGQAGVGFHLILEGKAVATTGDTKIGDFGPGDYFGEMSLLDGEPRSATVRAETDVLTLAISAWDFSSLIEKYPTIARKMLVEMSRRLRQADASLRH